MSDRIRLGISTCLLGERVRYDGGHKLDRYLRDTLGQFVEYVPVCPEVECGLPTPREAMRLVGDPESPRLVTRATGLDHTERMLTWARGRVAALEREDLQGFIFKSKSPSSGMEHVKVYLPSGGVVKKGVGMFARVFKEHFPLLPTEEEGRLNDPGMRDNFITRIFVLGRWRRMLAERSERGGLVDFHTRHKLLVQAHSPVHYRELGRLVANLKGRPLKEIQQAYQALLMEALKRQASVKKNTDVLTHMLGFLKKNLDADEKQELLEVIGHYHRGLVPLVVPVTLFKHFVRKYNPPYLKEQYYLDPHPMELQLRNHV